MEASDRTHQQRVRLEDDFVLQRHRAQEAGNATLLRHQGRLLDQRAAEKQQDAELDRQLHRGQEEAQE